MPCSHPYSPKPSLFSLEVTNVTTAVDIYSFGMCALEVRKPHQGRVVVVVVERGQISRWKGNGGRTSKVLVLRE